MTFCSPLPRFKRPVIISVVAFYSEKPAGDLIVGNVQKRYKKMESGVQNAKRVV